MVRVAQGSCTRTRVVGRAVIDPETGWLFTSLLQDLEWFRTGRARAELAELCRAPGDHPGITLVVGLDHFVDVRGLTLLLEIAALAEQHGRRFEVLLPPHSLRRMLAVLGLSADLTLAGEPGSRCPGRLGTPPEPAASQPTPLEPAPSAGRPEAGTGHAHR